MLGIAIKVLIINTPEKTTGGANTSLFDKTYEIPHINNILNNNKYINKIFPPIRLHSLY